METGRPRPPARLPLQRRAATRRAGVGRIANRANRAPNILAARRQIARFGATRPALRGAASRALVRRSGLHLWSPIANLDTENRSELSYPRPRRSGLLSASEPDCRLPPPYSPRRRLGIIPPADAGGTVRARHLRPGPRYRRGPDIRCARAVVVARGKAGGKPGGQRGASGGALGRAFAGVARTGVGRVA